MTSITVSRHLSDASDLVTGDPAVWLPTPARPAGPHRWTVDLRLGPLRRAVVVEVGAVWSERDRVGRPISWHTDPEQGDLLPYELLLPVFRGMAVADGDALLLEGRYAPPGGPLGRAADVLLGPLARRTIRNFVADLQLASRPARVGS